MRGMGTDHVISEAMRGLKKLHPFAYSHTHTDEHPDSKIELAQWADSVKRFHVLSSVQF